MNRLRSLLAAACALAALAVIAALVGLALLLDGLVTLTFWLDPGVNPQWLETLYGGRK